MKYNELEKIIIKKADGTEEFFNPRKLSSSLERAGATRRIIEKVLERIERELKGNKVVKTSTIFRRAFRILEEESRSLASKYSLKRALNDMGPSGFPFEHLITEIFKHKGYSAQTGVVIKGHCAEHEVDVLAENSEKFVMCEAKFHNHNGAKSDLKVTLYVEARYRDLLKNDFNGKKPKILDSEGWLVTNTKFTRNAIVYGKCSGLKMVSWNYPEEMSLRSMIEDANLHPISILSTLTNEEKRRLFDKGIVLLKLLIEKQNILKEMGMRDNRISEILKEARGIISINK